MMDSNQKERQGGRASSGPVHVVIVGAGFGGLTLARSLSKKHFRVTLIDRENHHLFQPLLYQVASAGLAPGDIAIPIRALFEKQEHVQVLMAEVSGVDLAKKEVRLARHASISYDHLVIAAGAETNYYGNDEWQDVAPGLKSVRDAVGIRERILESFEQAEITSNMDERQELLTFVVVGGGPTGVEMAGAIAELARHTLRRDFRRFDPKDVRVLLVEKMDRVLMPFPEKLSANAQKQLEALGVEVLTGADISDVDSRGLNINGSFSPAALVCWATGVKPVPLAAALGVELSRGRILVNTMCAVPEHPDVFAIGDIAAHFDAKSGAPLPGVAPVAIQQGRYLAKLFTDRFKGKPEKPFRYVDKGMMATVGRSRAVAQSGKIMMTGFVAWLAWLVVHLLYLVGFRNRFVVLINWVWSYVTYSRGSRLIAHHYKYIPTMESKRRLSAPPVEPSAPELSPSQATPASSQAASPIQQAAREQDGSDVRGRTEKLGARESAARPPAAARPPGAEQPVEESPATTTGTLVYNPKGAHATGVR